VFQIETKWIFKVVRIFIALEYRISKQVSDDIEELAK
jgi:hypothetical protein